MAARYSIYPPIPAEEYYSALMQAYLDQLQVDLRRQHQRQQSQSTQVEPNREKNVPVQEISTAITTDHDSAPHASTFRDEEAAFLKEHDDEADYNSEGYPYTSTVVSVLADLGIYLSDDELDD